MNYRTHRPKAKTMTTSAHDNAAFAAAIAIKELAAIARGADPLAAIEAIENLGHLADYATRIVAELPTPESEF